MNEKYDVGVLLHFPEGVSETLVSELIDLAGQWHGLSEVRWPFSVALLPTGDYCDFLFDNPDDANMFITHVEKLLQHRNDASDSQTLYSIVLCWTGLIGGES